MFSCERWRRRLPYAWAEVQGVPDHGHSHNHGHGRQEAVIRTTLSSHVWAAGAGLPSQGHRCFSDYKHGAALVVHNVTTKRQGSCFAINVALIDGDDDSEPDQGGGA